MTTKPKVEMHNAYLWVCDSCGRDNFERAIIAELPEDEQEEMFREFHGMEKYEPLPENWKDFAMMCYPDSVKCGHCGEWFDTEAPTVAEDDE